MTIEHISDGAEAHGNEDHIAVFTGAETTDILVLDGASSVADQDYIDPLQGDVTWFVHAFADAFQHVLAPERSQQECVHDAVAKVCDAFEQIGKANPAPLHAWPIAALTWLRIIRKNGAPEAILYSLGDCKSLLRMPDGACVDLDPFVNPQEHVVQAEIAKLRAAGMTDAAQRRAHMLPMLRARREFQNSLPAPEVLCLRPHGPFRPRTRRVDLAPDASVLVMTDGFYRLVDPYGLYTDAALMDACLARGLSAMLDELRTHEASAGGTGTQAVKAADDASALIWGARHAPDHTELECAEVECTNVQPSSA